MRRLAQPKDQETLDQGNLGEAERESEVKEYKLIAKNPFCCVSGPFSG